MGFRNPVTSASVVDTGSSPTGAGARLYQLVDDQGTRGVLELRDGIAGDTPAGVDAVAVLTPVDGGYVAQGSSTTVKGLGTNGLDAAYLELTTEAKAAGGYQSAARLYADVVEFPGTGAAVAKGNVVHGESTVSVQTTSNAEARLSGPQNVAAALVPGREYDVVFIGNLNAGVAAGRLTVNIRASAGAGVTPTTSSPVVATAMAWIAQVGGPGQETVTTAGQTFQVTTAGTYNFHTFAVTSAATGTAGLTPPASTVPMSTTVRDCGPALSTTRTLS